MELVIHRKVEPAYIKEKYSWYAIRPFMTNRIRPIVTVLEQHGVSYYRPFRLTTRNEYGKENSAGGKGNRDFSIYKTVVKADYENYFIFFYTTKSKLNKILINSFRGYGIVYGDPTGEIWQPLAIPHNELVQFQKLLALGCDYRILEDPVTPFEKGQKVVVTGGIYKNFHGVIYRILRQKHLIIRLTKQFAVMLGYVPTRFLRPVDDTETFDETNTGVEINSEDGNGASWQHQNASTDDDADFALNTSRLAIALRMLPSPKLDNISPAVFGQVSAAYEDAVSLRSCMEDIDTRLGFDIPASSSADESNAAETPVKDLDRLAFNTLKKLAETKAPQHRDAHREDLTSYIVRSIHKYCDNLRTISRTAID